MSVTQKEITAEQSWYEVETSVGTTFITTDEVGEFDLSQVEELNKLKAKLPRSVKGKILYIGDVSGVGARLRANTQWVVYPTIEEAEGALEDLHQLELEDEYGDDD